MALRFLKILSGDLVNVQPKSMILIISSPVLFLVRRRERFLDPPLQSINDHLFFSKFINYFSCYLGFGLVKTIYGPSVAARIG